MLTLKEHLIEVAFNMQQEGGFLNWEKDNSNLLTYVSLYNFMLGSF